METLLQDCGYAKVYYDKDLLLGKVIWCGNPNFEEYKKPFEVMLKFALKNRVDYFLSDTTNQGVISPDARKWFEKDMFPRAVESGLKRAAAISNANAFKKYYINAILTAINKFGVPMKLFSTQQEAIDWFNSCREKDAEGPRSMMA